MNLRRIAALAATAAVVAFSTLPTARAEAPSSEHTAEAPPGPSVGFLDHHGMRTPHIRTDIRSLYRRAGFTAGVVGGATIASATASPDGSASGQPVIVNRNAAGQLVPPGLRDHVDTYCDGVGNDLDRVQLMYLREASWTDRYAATVPIIRNEAHYIDDAFAVAAKDSGGGRRVRWVTDAATTGCTINVLNVVLPDGSLAGDFNTIETNLTNAGYLQAGRKYLAFAETTPTNSNTGCAQGRVIQDSDPTDNANDGRDPQLALLGSACWVTPSNYNSLSLHELLHTMGAVQPDAPHGTGGFHCTDMSETMCYNDGYATPSQVCPVTNEFDIDCNDDDYFNTAPAPGSYLATHWNVANSSFVATVPALPDPPALTITPSTTTPTMGDKVTFTASVPAGTTVNWSTDAPACEDSRVSKTGLTFSIQCFSQANATVLATASDSGITVRYAWQTIPFASGPAPALTISAPSSVTTGRQFTATAVMSNSASADFSYQWTVNPSGCTSSNGLTSQNVNVTCSAATAGSTVSLAASVTRINDGEIFKDTTGIPVAAPTSVGPTGTLTGPDSVIKGTSGLFSVTGADPATTYAWWDLNGWTGTGSGSTFEIAVPASTNVSTDTVYVTMTLNGQTLTLSKNYGIEKPLSLRLSGPAELSTGAPGEYTATTNKAASFDWSLDGPCVLSASTTSNARTVTCPGDSAGVATLTVVASASTERVTRAQTISFSPPLAKATELRLAIARAWPTRLTARLHTSSGEAVTNQDIELQTRSGGDDTWSVVETGSTDAAGEVRWETSIRQATTYRTVFAGDPTYAASTSPVRTAKIVLEVAPRKTQGGLRAAVTTPWGAEVGGVKLRLQRRPAGAGRWSSFEKLTTRDNGRATIKINPDKPTDYRWRFAGDANYYARTSTTVRLR